MAYGQSWMEKRPSREVAELETKVRRLKAENEQLKKKIADYEAEFDDWNITPGQIVTYEQQYKDDTETIKRLTKKIKDLETNGLCFTMTWLGSIYGSNSISPLKESTPLCGRSHSSSTCLTFRKRTSGETGL